MKKTILTLTVLLALLANLPAISQNTSLANIDEYITNWMNVVHKPGMAAVIVKGDSIVWKGNFGYANLEDSIPVTDSTLFNAFSIGKSITAACFMNCWEQGLVDLDVNVNTILPFMIDNPYHDYDSITPRMLMSHTACIQEVDPGMHGTIGDPEESLDSFLENYFSSSGAYYSPNNFLSQQLGTTYMYSNYGPGVTGYVAGLICSEDFKNLCRETIFIPLDMLTSAWFLADLNVDNLAIGYDYSGGQYVAYQHRGHPAYPGLSVRSTALELTNYGIMLLNHGKYNGTQILEQATMDTMMFIHYPMAGGHVGLGLYRMDVVTPSGTKVIWGHQGGSSSGYSADVRFCPEDNTLIVYMSNSGIWAHYIRKRMLEYAAMIVVAESADSVNAHSFKAKWQHAPDAGGYLLDVALDESFTNFVPGYEQFMIGSDTNVKVENLEPNTEYFYRLCAINDWDTGAYSNTISLITELASVVAKNQRAHCEIYSSNRNILITLPEESDYRTSCSIYTLSGQLIKKAGLQMGTNNLPVPAKNQILIVRVSGNGWEVCRKVRVE